MTLADRIPKRPAGNFVKWEVMGVPVSGVATDIITGPNNFKKKETDPDENTYLVLTDATGDPWLVNLGLQDLAEKLTAQGFDTGDLVTITWIGNKSVGAGTKKLFKVEVVPHV